ATLRQIGVLRNGDIERLAEGNAIGAQHENGVAVGHIFIGRGAARNKSGRWQSRPARLGTLLRQSRYQGSGPCQIAAIDSKTPMRNSLNRVAFLLWFLFEHDLFRKPVPILGSSPRTSFFWDHAHCQ